ncbi:MAG TPA: SLBB domain-containing protein [Chitinophagales bacterium]|nr:SLBB domain-containing protein [Chitinophagales bacterium]
MKNFSSAALLVLTIGLFNTLNAQTPVIPGVSSSTLESLGFDSGEIDAIMSTTGASTSIEAAASIQDAQQSAVQQANDQLNSLPPAVTETAPPAALQAVLQDEPQAGPAAPVVWGQDFFRNGSVDLFDKVPNAKVNDNYIIGEGDQLTISVWGYAYYNSNFTVNDEGYITTVEVGRIYVKGLTYSAARQLLRQRFASAFDLVNSKFDVALTYSKTIKVNIVGEVVNPGSYNVSSLNTAFNALVAAGGVTDIGSVRNIQVKRNGKIIKTLDVYQFLMNPGSTDDTYLEANDYIIVNGIGRVVDVMGEINRPMKYELVKGENLNELITYAGGLKSTAYKRNVTIYRYYQNENIVLDFNLDSLERERINFNLLDGDKITFARIPEVVENVVTIQGSCRFPGNYQLSEGMRIYDLITKAKGLNYDAYTDRAYLIRKNDKLNDIYVPFDLGEVLENPSSPFNFELTKFDVIDIFSKEEFRETFTVSVQGSVKTPGSFPYYEKMTLKDLLYYAGGLRVEAANSRIEISRIVNFNEASNDNEPTRVVIQSVTIGKLLELDDAANTFQLQPYDQVFVRNTPEFEYQKNVTLLGEVKYPGTYTLTSRTETLADLIERAGGLTQWAYAEGATMNRSDVTSTLVFLHKALENPESKYNYVLREGDVVTVPKQGDLVALKGEIRYPFIGDPGNVIVPFEKGRSARHYIRKYGKNFGDNAKRSETYIIEPNGYVRRTHNFLFIHFYPRVKVKGCQVVVPAKPEEKETPDAPTAPSEPFDWNTFMSTLSAGILSFATIYVLVARVPAE